MKLHVLKIKRRFFDAVMSERKKAELRKDDREYRVGDLIHFTDTLGNEYEGMFNLFTITHVLPCRSVLMDCEDYVVLSIIPYLANNHTARY